MCKCPNPSLLFHSRYTLRILHAPMLCRVFDKQDPPNPYLQISTLNSMNFHSEEEKRKSEAS